MEWLSRDTKRTLFEMSVGIVLFDLLLCVLAWLFLPKVSYPVVPVLKGLMVGAAGAILMLVHIAVITERALDSRDESYANKYTVAQSMVRKVVFLAALFFVWRVIRVDLLATVIGAMGMKAGAYLQPLIRRLSGHGEKSEVSEQTDSESL
ncbi:MAG: hypothetical protein MR868_12055 [Lachnospiraceae bacterium]|nr:hypothetical protein [Lachnospiraceae bacterium]